MTCTNILSCEVLLCSAYTFHKLHTASQKGQLYSSFMHNSKLHVTNCWCFLTCWAFGMSLELAPVCDPSSPRLTHFWIYEVSLFLLLPDSSLLWKFWKNHYWQNTCCFSHYLLRITMKKNELRCVTNPNNSAQVVKFAGVFFWAFSIMLTQVLSDDCSGKRLLFTENSKIKSILLNWLVSPKIYSLFSKLIGSTSPFLFQYNSFSFSVSSVRSSLCL